MKKPIILIAAATLLLTACSAATPSVGETAPSASPAASTSAAAQETTAPSASEADSTAEAPGAEPEPQESSLESFEVVGNSKKLSLTPLCQYPELPTGCEVTSLCMVLNYYGVACGKCEIADNYLKKGAVGTVDFHEAFEGDPRDDSSYGCYAGVIVDAANAAIAAKGASLAVSDLTGASLDSLFAYIDRDVPVIVWGTQDCREGHYSVTWNIDGKELTWFTPEHCMVLVGYDDGSVWVADPIYGDVRSYDKASFESSYQSLYQQAVVVAP